MNRENAVKQNSSQELSEQNTRRKSFDSDLSITEAQLLIADKNKAVKSLRIEKVAEVHHVYVQLTWRKDELVLTTTRTYVKPREFKHFGRLVEYIEKTCPSVTTFSVHIEFAGERNRRTH